MNARNVTIDAAATCGSTAIVTAVRPKYKYVNGAKTNEQEGYSISCVLPERSYQDLTVTVPAIPPELEDLHATPLVRFDGLALTIYGRSDDLRIAARAAAVYVIGADGD